MTKYLVSAIAGQRLDEIYSYSQERWGYAQAETYIRNLFACFDAIAKRNVPWRAIPAEFGIDGFYHRCHRHFVYWRVISSGEVGIVTALHERMHQMERFNENIEP